MALVSAWTTDGLTKLADGKLALFNNQVDTATGTIKPQDGPLERAGTEKDEARRGGTSLGAERDRPPGGR